MSAKAIREFDGKSLLARWFDVHSRAASSPGGIQFSLNNKLLQITGEEGDPIKADGATWAATEKLVAKPDQLIKRRGKGGLLLLNEDWASVESWVGERLGKALEVEGLKGHFTHFIVEPFVPHDAKDEYYLCMLSTREGTEILFHHEGGVEVGDVDAKAVRLTVPVHKQLSVEAVSRNLLAAVDGERKSLLASFICQLYMAYTELHFTYLEINPIVVDSNNTVHVLDLAAKLDQTADFLCGKIWGEIDFPAPFGREMSKEEQYIADLDAKTGASLKLTILNKAGRVWTMVAGGGASVVYSDTICDIGFASELANYGEYSGAPTESQTYEYAKTILELMTAEAHPEGKVLIVGGGIANFTNVASTFKGITKAIREFSQVLIAQHVKIYVRRGGPNYLDGLRVMRTLGEELGVFIDVYGPDTHITSIVPLALGKAVPESRLRRAESNTATSGYTSEAMKDREGYSDIPVDTPSAGRGDSPPAVVHPGSPALRAKSDKKEWYDLFTKDTCCLVYGMQQRAVQGMLDFDSCCGRKTPSVSGIVYPFGGNHFVKFYWGTKEVLMPVYQHLDEALAQHKEVDTIVNFASFRSVYESTTDILAQKQIRTVAIIAEGVPEQQSKMLIDAAAKADVTIIGPATVGGIKPGAFRIGNTGGMIDNIISSKLYRPGHVAYVSKSGGMSNELNNIIAHNADGVFEGVAIGGDRYPGTVFLDHLLRFEANPGVAMLVLLGEVGGVEEYRICEAIRDGRIKKPIVAWCIGTCSKLFGAEVQFGHAGALAGADAETAEAKNEALKAAGAIVPPSFDDLGDVVRTTFIGLVDSGKVTVRPEPPVPKVPIDFNWARELGLVRKPSSFISTICDDRGQELLYAGMSISSVFEEDIGIGGVLSLLWFRRRLPAYATKFIEMVLMVTADHGPAVSGAHNTIVTARAGKDLVSSLVSGLLTIGDRFGGALDGAAALFSEAFDAGQTPQEFVDHMRKSRRLILGIGHKIKSLQNPDLRVSILKEYAQKHFPSTQLLDFALEVEKITTTKKSNLILNVDGAVAAIFVDLLRNCGAFTRNEADEYIKIGILNGLFVLGRSIGFIGHFIDQSRLKQPLYRHDASDIAYMPASHQ